MKIRLLNVKYSPNIGDGLLVECLEQRCRAYLPGADIASLDLAGRTAFGDSGSSKRRALRALNALPPLLRQGLVGTALGITVARRLADHYREGLSDSDAIVIGGGHLLSDVDLNFPVKLWAALQVAAERRIPVWIHGCGVSAHWSPLGTALFRAALMGIDLVDVAVRDTESATCWNARLGIATGRSARVVRDPGVLAARVYEASSARHAPGGVGLGVIGPAAIHYHGGPKVREDALLRWYLDLGGRLARAGKHLTIVSNGSWEDEEFAQRLTQRMRSLPGCDSRVALARHRTPSDLVQTMASLECLVAFRMHALIAAASLGVPTFALAWDAKVLAFMRGIGREQHYYHVDKTSPDHLSSVVLDPNQDAADIESERTACDRDIENLCSSIVARCGTKRLAPDLAVHA